MDSKLLIKSILLGSAPSQRIKMNVSRLIKHLMDTLNNAEK